MKRICEVETLDVPRYTVKYMCVEHNLKILTTTKQIILNYAGLF
jgi:hypothetical protein